MRVLLLELREPLHCLVAKHRGVVCDRGFSRPFDVRHSAIQRCNQFAQLTEELGATHHRRARAEVCSRRATFQISPQLWQRQ